VVEHIHGTPMLRLRDRLLPLVNLTDLLALGSARDEAADAGGERSVHVVVAQVGAALLGIIVDRVFDTEEIVVKPVAPILRHITMFSGNTILGDGSVIMILDPNGIARATGVAGGSGGAPHNDRHTDSDPREAALAATRTRSNTAMLLFRAGGAAPKAVPLGLVARLEDLPRERIELSAGQPVTQYRGRLMPLVPFSGTIDPTAARHAVLVFTDGDRGDGNGQQRCMGLLVDEIVDVVEDPLDIELARDRPGLLGTAVIAGHATDVIDIGYWLTQAWQDWFRRPERSGTQAGHQPRLLVVEDSDFFRQLLVPTLSAAGYRVSVARDAAEALGLRDAGAMFDAIVSDIEMPHIDGRAMVRQIRAGGAWAQLPVIALSSHAGPDSIDAAREAGFTDYLAKFEREALLASLAQCLAAAIGRADGAQMERAA
jgi:two-component system, chemotaxis family, sensor kinase CheA